MRLPMGKRSCAAVPKRQIAQNALNAFMPLPFERLCRVHCHFGKDSVQIAQNAFFSLRHLAALPRARHCHFGKTFWLKNIFGMFFCGWRTQAGQPCTAPMPCKWHAAARAKEALEKQLEQQRQAKRAKYLEKQKELRRKERHEQHRMEMHDRR